jgi:hypothetical protein
VSHSYWQRGRTIATRLGLSDRGLAKICVRLHVPLPGRGYWQKKAAGHEVRRVPLRSLPDTTPLTEREVVIGGEYARRREASVSAAGSQQTALERAPDRAIRIAAVLEQPHPLVQMSARSLRRAKGDHRGLLVPEAQRILDIRVTRGTLERSLLISDALIKALEDRGYPVSCTAAGERKTSVQVSEEDIAFLLEERVRREERPPDPRRRRGWAPYSLSPSPQYKYVATGHLAIKLTEQDFGSRRRTWQDTPKRTLETQLNRFIVGLVATAAAKKVERKRREEAERLWEERRRQEDELRRLRLEEERKRRLLESDLPARAKSQEIRAYVEGARTAAARRANPDAGRGELEEWLSWAANYADRIDPALRDTVPRDSWRDTVPRDSWTFEP